MNLYTNPASPFCRKVEVVLIETGQHDSVERMNVAGHPTDTATMPVERNPLGKIPVLVTEDDNVLYDSRVICRYLDDLSGAGFYPQDRLWDILTVEAMADGICDAAVLMVYEERARPEEGRYAPWVEGQWAKVSRALDTLDASRLEGPLNMGQIAVACALGYLDFRHENRAWRDGRDELAAWFEGFNARPSMQATSPG